MSATKPKVYVETTVVSYLTARPSRDIVTLAHQHITREWWRSAARRFDLVASDIVRDEAAGGDPEAARGRH
ncbi:MAG: type II toxin-antitoxin system VapC family toxin [Holophagales bacterium]|nr:type II toxin-antitoxin system VapC family toxin [Holophagales bacterium]MYF95352.1 type II toxin-antitoxin system VapC family toxin [Holophagales bacterium]